MLKAAPRRTLALVAAVFALFVASLSIASARTFHHGMNVWFSDETLSNGDDVPGDLDIYFGNVTCSDGAHIEGNVRKFFGSFDQSDDCTVDGRVIDAFDSSSFVPVAPWTSRLDEDFSAQNRAFFNKIGWDVVVLFAFLLFPLRTRIALDRVEHHPGLSVAAGLIGIIGALPLAILLLITVIGIPVIVLEFAALFACLWIGWAAVALVVGRRLVELTRPHHTPSPLTALVTGLVVVTAAQMLPLVGWAVTSLVIVTALGAALLALVRETAFRSFTGAPFASGPGGGAPPPATPPRVNRPA
jgi:hypothetical protein